MILDVNKIDNFTITNIPDTELEIKSDTFHSLLEYLFRNRNYEILKHPRTLITDKDQIKQILYDNHDTPISGHQGFERTYDKVILCDSHAKNTSKRLCENFKGPYKIIQIHNNQTATLEIGNKLKTYHFNQLKPFYELSDNANEQNDSDMDIDYDPSLDDPGPSNRQ
ncbi:hypothetical protein HHI36_008054 [Cryptolaemus montrouzieri]|uniref:Uncharacterized protein n=1 Tax=Cryptolaemus montrouzieri TaxID=559131 RepID=A0ABD2MRF0_9CUCU